MDVSLQDSKILSFKCIVLRASKSYEKIAFYYLFRRSDHYDPRIIET